MRRTLPRMRTEHGVSEVMGTILILAMTVVLFATIIIWVTTIPTPASSIRLDMDGQLAPILDGGGGMIGANFTVQHRGGETLFGVRTTIYFTVISGPTLSTLALQTRGMDQGLPYGIDGPDANWDAGEVWAYTNWTVRATHEVTISVADDDAAVVVWRETLTGPVGEHPPVFVEKWLDGDTATAITRDTPLTGLPFGLYARIEDPDGDLIATNVSAKYTFGPHATYLLYDDATNGDRVADDGIFTLFDPDVLAAKSWDGRIIILKAEDLGGQVTESRLIFQVLQNPNEPPDPTAPQGPGDLPWRNELQAYAIYNSSEWDLKRWAADETRTFRKEEWVVVIVATQYLRNLDLQNDFMLYDTTVVPQRSLVYSNPPYYNVAPYVRPVTTTSAPSTTNAFTFLEETDGYSVWEYRFKTNSSEYGNDGFHLVGGRYHMEITLRSSGVSPPRNQFNTVAAMTLINVTAPAYPVVEFFRDSGHTLKTDQFNFTDTVHVRVRVASKSATVSGGDIVVSDFIGGIQIWARPNAGAAPPIISSITLNGSGEYYRFTMDLSRPRDPWVTGLNAHAFRIKLLTDNNEAYTLSESIRVRGPRWSLDIVSGIQEYVNTTPAESWYLTLHDNDRLWSPYQVEKYSPFERLFAGQGSGAGDGDVLVNDGASWTMGYDGAQADINALATYNGRLYAAQGTGGTAGDVLVSNPWAISYDGAQEGINALAVYNGRLYAGQGTGGGDGAVLVFDGTSWTVSGPPALQEYITSLAVYNNKLYAGQGSGTGDGDILVYDGTTWTVSYDGAQEFITSLAVYNNKLYAGQGSGTGDGDILVYDGVAPWATSYNGAQELIQALAVFNGKLYAGQAITTGDGDVLVYDGVAAWATSFNGAQEAINSLAVYNNKLYAGQGSGTGDGDVFVFDGTTWTVSYDGAQENIRSFAVSSTTPAWGGGRFYQSVLSDLDDDGDLDVVAGLESNGYVWWYRNLDGRGRVWERLQIDVVAGAQVRAIASGRLDRDLDNDVVAGLNGGQIYWYANDGLWTRTTIATLGAGVTINALRIADADMDGDKDVIVATNTNPQLRIYWNDGNGVFASSFGSPNLGAAAVDLGIADMDNDTDNDVVVGYGTSFRVFRGPTFGASWTVGITDPILSLDVGLIDAGDEMDVITGTNTGLYSWWRNAGAGSFIRNNIDTLAASDDVLTLRVGDVDGDLLDDVVIGSLGGLIRWSRHLTTGLWDHRVIRQITTNIQDIDLGDVDRGIIIDRSVFNG